MTKILTVLGMVALACAGPVPLSYSAAPVAARATSPNVMVIIIDDARLDDMTTMPVAEQQIAEQGVEFTNMLAPFPLCCPARATILTGQYAHNHGVLGNAAPIGGFHAFDDSSTLATWMTPTYRTAWVGKYMNQYSQKCCSSYVPPGWDYWAGALGQSFANYQGTHFNVNGRVVDYTGRYQTDVDTQLTTDFIHNSVTAGQPFFAVTSYFAPHTGTPYEPDDPHVVYNTSLFETPNVGPYRDALAGWPLSGSPSYNEADVSDKPAYIRNNRLLRPWMTAAQTEVNQQRRESMLSVEDGVQAIMDQLAAEGVLDNTYVIFTSDNGFVIGEHRIRKGKSNPYEPSVRVPMFIRGPGIPAGSVVDQQAGHQDIASTVLAVTGQSATRDALLDGVNVLDMVGNPTAYATRPIVLEVGPDGATDSTYFFHGVRTNEYKYVVYDTGEKELYNLRTDPDELENLAGNPAYAGQQETMQTLLEQYQWCAGAQCQ